MKFLLVTAFATLSLSAFAQNIFDYSVYTTDGIEAACGGFNGKIGSTGKIILRDFLVTSLTNDCAIESNRPVDLTLGSLMDYRGDLSCARTPRLDSYGTGYSEEKKYAVDFSQINTQLASYSQKLTLILPQNKLLKKYMSPADILNARTILLNTANSEQYLVVQVSGKEVNLVGKGIALNSILKADKIIWNFYEAETIKISNSGAADGIPGTFFAPNATVYFNNAKINGALFAKKVVGAGYPDDCSQKSSGGVVQKPINKSLLDIIVR